MYNQVYTYNYYDVFNKLNQLDVWSDILGTHVSIGQMVTSPFRPDQHPHCIVTEYNNTVFITDFAYPVYNRYTCVHAVALFKNIGLNAAASLICNKFLHGLDVNLSSIYDIRVSNVIKKASKSKEIYFESFLHDGKPTFTEFDKEYWSLRGVRKAQLNRHNVYSVHHYYIGDSYITPNHPMYAYYFPKTGRKKFYSPFEKKENKWFGDTTVEDIWMSINGGDYYFINKSAKDLMVSENVLPMPDFDIYSPQNEGCHFDIGFTKKYKKGGYLLYDNDAAGRRAATIQKKRIGDKCNIIFIPEEFESKDTDELYVNYGETICKQTILNLL